MARVLNPSPLRYQVKKIIVDYLIQQGYEVGDRIPTEQELGEILGVSRFSLREGLHLLEVERILSTKHGIGRFLLSKPNDINIEITSLQSVPELLASFNIESKDKILSVQEIESEGDISHYLEVKDGTSVISIERMRYAKETPIIYSIDTFLKEVLPEGWRKEDFQGSLFSYLESSCKIKLDYSLATIRAALLPEEIRQKISDSTALWILLEQTMFSQDGRAVIYSKDYHNSNHINFHVRRLRR
jgi:GntR family transcriptional regulator